MLHPGAQMPQRHDLAAEQNFVYRLRRLVIQTVESADQAQRGDCPDHGGDAMFTQKIQVKY